MTSERDDESGLRQAELNKMIRKLLHDKRWQVSDEVKRKAIAVTERNIDSEDERVSNGAVQNLLKMEAQNQADVHKIIPSKTDVTTGGKPIVGIENMTDEQLRALAELETNED